LIEKEGNFQELNSRFEKTNFDSQRNELVKNMREKSISSQKGEDFDFSEVD
jgi:hypothetical protein